MGYDQPSYEPLNYLDDLRHLSDDWSDEIPGIIVHSGEYKVRKAWFTSVCNYMNIFCAHGGIGKDSEALYRGLVSHIYRTGFHGRDTRPEDIEMGNALLASVIAGMEDRAEVLAQAEDILQADPEDDAVRVQF